METYIRNFQNVIVEHLEKWFLFVSSVRLIIYLFSYLFNYYIFTMHSNIFHSKGWRPGKYWVSHRPYVGWPAPKLPTGKNTNSTLSKPAFVSLSYSDSVTFFFKFSTNALFVEVKGMNERLQVKYSKEIEHLKWYFHSYKVYRLRGKTRTFRWTDSHC